MRLSSVLWIVVGLVGLCAFSLWALNYALRGMDLDLEQIERETGWLETIVVLEPSRTSRPSPTPSGPVYTVVMLPLPADADGGEAHAINDAGEVAGRVYTLGPTGWSRAVVWDDGGVRVLPSLSDGGSSGATAIDNQGRVAGWAETATGDHYAVLWTGDVILDLGTLGGAASEAADLNETGQVVGWAETAAGQRRAFLWADGAMRDLGTIGGGQSEAAAINDGGEIVGWAETASLAHQAFLWQSGVMSALLGPDRHGTSEAIDINNNGQVVGELYPGPDAFLWEHGEFTYLFGLERAPRTYTIAINETGQILASNDANQVVIDGGSQEPLPPPSWAWFMDAVLPMDINERGQVAGYLIPTTGANRPLLWDPPAGE